MTATRMTGCCIAGGGPAGMMLGYLLARGGVDVVVLEKHADFFRDFRGDTVHPSTLEVMHELGILDDFLARPHQELSTLVAQVGDQTIAAADFTHLPTHCKFLVLMPQWDFLDFVAEKARAYASFTLLMRHEATDIFEEHGKIVGLRAMGPDGPIEIRAQLTVGADGRGSVVRAQAGLEVQDFGAPMDVLWFSLPRHRSDPVPTFRFVPGVVLVTIDRGDYWQCGMVIAKEGYDAVRAQGLPALQDRIASIAPFLGDRVGGLDDWNRIKLLTVKVDRLRMWCRPGLLCIGDAAHAMSPIGGVGINLAIQDAVAAANALVKPLRRGSVGMRSLRAVQRRRFIPTMLTQSVQLAIQRFGVRRILEGSGPVEAPWPIRLLQRYPALRRVPALVVGVGFGPEHVRAELRGNKDA